MQIFVPGTEQGFKVRSNLDALLHSVFALLSLVGCALPAKPVLASHCRDTGTSTPVSATTKVFSLQVEPAGMLAPEVQATTIEVKGTPRVGPESIPQAILCRLKFEAWN
jgi:hypothetical protein